MRKVALAVGLVEALGFVSYAVTILVVGLRQENTPSAPAVEAAIYLIFAALLAVIVWLLAKGNSAARSPFVLAQLFGLIISYTLIVGDGMTVKIIGGAIGVLSVAGLVGLIKSSPNQ